MGKYGPGDIKSLCLVGHGDAGKTTLADKLLFAAKATPRCGNIKDKSSLFDSDDIEQEKQHSLEVGFANLEWEGRFVTIIDTPGYPDFIGDAICGMASSDMVAICINAHSGVGVNTRRTWDAAEEMKKARCIIVTKCDSDDADLDATLASIEDWFGEKCAPIYCPDGFGPSFKGTEDLLRTSGGDTEQGKAFFERFIERSVEADDDVMTAYLDGEKIDDEVLRQCVISAVAQGLVVPILFTSSEKDIGIVDVLDVVRRMAPNAVTSRCWETAEGDAIEVSAEAPFLGQVTKVMVDKHVGKVSYVRIVNGSMNGGDHFVSSGGGRKDKIGHIHLPFGKELKAVDSATAGHLVALTKLDNLHIGDTLTVDDSGPMLRAIPFPKPMAQLAVRPASRADETKITEALRKLADESPTFTIERDQMTNEQVASGSSALHLDMCFRRLKDRYGIEVETSVARVPYRECITKVADGHYRHKKQSGGRGQFGEVFLKVSPAAPGEGLVFDWDIVGGSIPTNFSPAVEKGIREKMVQGVIAGYPILDIRVSVYDGKFHDVDSSEAAFKTAGGRAFAEAVVAAKPVLLEPMVDAEIVVPSDNLGDISGDLNTRRGRINGMEAKGSFQVISAVAPKAEMAEYPRILTSLTSGEGSFSYDECGYEQVPANVQAQITAAYKPHADDD